MNMRSIISNPEINVVFFSFAFHFIWELIQIPAYAGLAEINHWQGVLICSQATAGDVGIALAAFWTTSIVAHSRLWITTPTLAQITIFLSFGVAVTIALEYVNTQLTHRWAYSDLMPVVPLLGTGLSPLLQWVFVPLLVLFVVRRQIRS